MAERQGSTMTLEAAIDHALRVEGHVFIFIMLAIRGSFIALLFTSAPCFRHTGRRLMPFGDNLPGSSLEQARRIHQHISS